MEKHDIEYLKKRAILFFEYLETERITNVFPYREASEKELEKLLASENYRKLLNFNKILDDLIIGKSGFTREQKLGMLSFLDSNLGSNVEKLVDLKLEKYYTIKNRGIIKSSIELNDAIEIANSDILGLSEEEIIAFRKIISNSMVAKI